MTPPLLLLALAACGANPDTRTAPPRTKGRASRVDERFTEAPALDDGVLRAGVGSDADDGLRTAGGWAEDGEDGLLVVRPGTTAVLRFELPEALGRDPVHARLVLPIGPNPSGTRMRIRAVLDDERPPGDVTPAGELAVDWVLDRPLTDAWASAPERKDNVSRLCAPFLRTTPDLSPLLAGHPSATSVTVLLEGVEDGGSWPIVDRVEVEDPECVGLLSARLEVRPTVRSALAAHEMLGRPTDDGVTVSLLSLVDAEVRLVSRVIGGESATTEPVALPAGRPVHVPLVVGPNASARYHVEVRRGPDDAWEAGPDHSFHTRRPSGQPFAFTVTADGHYINMEHRRAWANVRLLQRTMEQIGREHPDFHLDLGDTFNGESYRSFDATDDEEMARRHLAVRPWFEIVGAGAPVLLALGNHEGEQGWRAASDPVPALSARWRRGLFPNPPGGDADADGPLENYYATRWGDVLIVVLDPFRHTMRKPHDLDGHPGSGDRWDWTLGEEQQAWLRRTLQESDAPYKLVFSHQVVGGNSDYGRGGRPQNENGSYEMGGTGPDGRPEFPERRPGWPQPLHELMRDTGVTAFVHGHDHAFVFDEPLDGVAYVTVPQPGSADYDLGHIARSGYDERATVIANTGYVLFRTNPQGKLEMSYVRIRLPGDGIPRETAFQHVFEPRR
ncbi:MAG: metallophosphoesterase [Alphaproteobacteria bacterium]|nr:metallophosphoesterase [Alphaproteobacteria bacterium]